MHTIFRVPELWSYILTPDLDKSALNAAARTCHALKEPALDALWRNLNSIEPLLLLLGEIQYGPDTVTQSYRVRESCSTEDVVSGLPQFLYPGLRSPPPSSLWPSGNLWNLAYHRRIGRSFSNIVGESGHFNSIPTLRWTLITNWRSFLSGNPYSPQSRSLYPIPCGISHSFRL